MYLKEKTIVHNLIVCFCPLLPTFNQGHKQWGHSITIGQLISECLLGVKDLPKN